MWQLW
jgi:hypothetical protein